MRVLISWLEDEFAKKHIAAHIYAEQSYEKGKWYFVPVYVETDDVYDMATLLIEVEDEWEKQAVESGRNLMLMPAAKPVSAAVS